MLCDSQLREHSKHRRAFKPSPTGLQKIAGDHYGRILSTKLSLSLNIFSTVLLRNFRCPENNFLFEDAIGFRNLCEISPLVEEHFRRSVSLKSETFPNRIFLHFGSEKLKLLSLRSPIAGLLEHLSLNLYYRFGKNPQKLTETYRNRLKFAFVNRKFCSFQNYFSHLGAEKKQFSSFK